MFIYFSQNNPKDYKVDGYLWKNKGGHKPTPVENPVVSKTYYDVKYGDNQISNEFSKIVYESIDKATKTRKFTPIICPLFKIQRRRAIKFIKFKM